MLTGEHPQIHYDVETEQAGNAGTEARERVKQLVVLRKAMEKRWQNAVEQQAKYYNRSHEPITFAVHDWAMLSTQHLKLKVPSRKLAPRFIGPFRIAEPVGPQAYRLHLPATYRIHDVFHVSRLEKYNVRDHGVSPELPPAIMVDEQEEWEVLKILKKRRHKREVQYLVRWVGWPPEYDQWVTKADLNAPDLLREFESEEQPNRQRARPRKRG